MSNTPGKTNGAMTMATNGGFEPNVCMYDSLPMDHIYMFRLWIHVYGYILRVFMYVPVEVAL